MGAYAPPPMSLEPDALLALLRDPNAESQQIAAAAGVPREEVGRAARLVLTIGRAKAEDVATLPAPLALAALRAAVAANRTDLITALAAGPAKEAGKEAKRLLHQLRSRGVAVPELPRVAAPAAPAPAEPDLPCYASTLDGQGERAVWLARNLPGRGVEVGQFVLSDEKGLASFQPGALGRKEYRAFGQELTGRGGSLGVREVPRELAHALVGDARRRTESQGRALPDGAALWLSRLGEAPALPDPAAAFAPLPPGEEEAAVAASADLHRLPILKGWAVDDEALDAAEARLAAIADSPLLADMAQRREQAAQALDAILREHFDEARRARWARRLWHTAAHLAGVGDPGSAALAAASARALLSGADVAAIPFARQLFEKALQPAGAGTAAAKPARPAPLISGPR